MNTSQLVKIFTIFVSFLILLSCSDTKVIDRYTYSSPDRNFLVNVQTEQSTGPGNASVITIVGLQQAHIKQRSTDILVLENQKAPSNRVYVIWEGNHTLKLTYSDARVSFAAIKCLGFDILIEKSALVAVNVNVRRFRPFQELR